MKKHILYIILAILSVAALSGHAEQSSIFEDPAHPFGPYGPTKTVPLWPLYYYKIYTSKAAYRKHILWPIYTRTVTPEQKVNQILSFQNKYPRTFSNQTYVLWPFVGFQSSPKFGYNNWIFPIIWQSNVKDHSKHNVVFPLYWYYRPYDGGETKVLNIALLNHNYWGPGYHNHLLLPIAWTKWGQKRGFNGYSHLLFPLFYANRDEELAEGKYGKTMHTLRERAFITLFYRWYRDKDAPEGLAQVNDVGVFPLSFYKKENYLYYANGNIIRNKIFFLFPAFVSIRFKVVRPDKVPETFEELDQTPGTKVLHRDGDFYFPLYLRSYGYEITDSPHDLKNVEQIPSEHDYRWYFPYYSFYNREPVRSLELQGLEVADDKPKDIFMPTRIQGNLDDYEKRTSGVPLLYHNSRKTWKDGTTKKMLVDQRFFYLFPYLSRYAKNKNAEGRQSSVMILAGWGNADLKIPDYPGYSQKYSFLFPLYYHSRRHSIGATPYSLDDKENSRLWLFPYYHTSKRIGKSIGRTDSLFPLAYMSDEEHAHRNWWFGLLAGNFERQIPLQSKFDSDKYPVTIYEDEDPLDYTRKVSFLLPFWYSKYNLNSAFWMLFPFYGKSQSMPADDTATRSTIIPLAIARFKTSEKEDGSVEKRDFAAAGLYYRSSDSTPGNNDAPQSSYWHAIPFYAKTVKPGHTRVTASIPPLSYDHYTIPVGNGRISDSRAFASPHRWLPIFKTLHQETGLPGNEPDSILSSHWLFPFYSVRTNKSFDYTTTEQDDDAIDQKAIITDIPVIDDKQEEDTAKQEDDSETEKQPIIKKYDRKTTVGAGLLYYNNLNDGLQNQFILSGIATTKSRDPLMFGTNSAFFGLYGKENLSWKNKNRFSPIYSKTINQDKSSESSVLFGMFGTKKTKAYRVNKIFFYPRVTPVMEPDDLSEDEQLEFEKKLRQQHLVNARMYAEMNYPEHAAVEFLLADGEYDNDLELLRIAADQFAILVPEKLEKLLKKVPAHLLARTPAFSPDTFITYYPEEVYAKAADLYHKILATIETDGSSENQTSKQASKQNYSSASLALALLCYKYEKFDQCFDILKQRYEKTESKLDGLDMLHFYEDYAINHLKLSRTKPHHALTKVLRDKFPGDPILEFYHAKQELSPFKDAYLEDLGIPLLLEVLELNGENIQQAPEDRGQVLRMPSWPEPFNDVSPEGFPNLDQVFRATHHELAMCFQSKLKTVRPDVFGIVRLSSIYAPNSVYAKQIRKQQMSMTDEERRVQTAVLINNIMLHLSQGTKFEPFRKTLETKELYPCRRIQSMVLQALKKDYQIDLEYNHYEPRKEQLVELDKILWQTSFDISFLRNWNATFVKGIPSDKGKGPLAVVADPNGFVDIDYAFDGIDNCTVEATTQFHNYFAQKLALHVGFDHTLSIELNGEHVFGPSSQHIARRDQETVILDIPEGDISLKFIISDDKLNYGFFARFTDEDGMPFFFNDLHQLNCKVCGDQIENWTQAITPQLKALEKKAQ